MDILLLLIGLVLLFLGGEALLRGSVALAEKFNLSTLLVSMVIVGFGTSAPELIVSVTSALKGAPNLALGNIVGSNIANVLLILGVAAILAPIACSRPEIKRDALAVLLASLVLLALAQYGVIGRLAGGVMLASLIVYLSYAFLTERKNGGGHRERIEKDVGKPPLNGVIAATFAIAGLLFLVGGAHLLVEGATSLAKKMGISNAIIGLSIVAVGTSLPELAIAVVAAYRKHHDVVLGNIVGSNLFNILGVLGVTAIATPIPVEKHIADIDVWIMVGVAIALTPLIWTGREISRMKGGVFLALYILYIVWLYTTAN